MAARITELRLTSFKSFRDVAVPLRPLSVLIGRNGGGKSNVRDALEGMRRDDVAVRGGAEGCAPFGSDAFELGVRLAR